MFGLPLGNKNDALPPIQTVLNEAIALMQAGQTVDAEAHLRHHAERVEQERSTQNANYSDAEAALAAFYALLGRPVEALYAHERAQEWEPPRTDKDARKNWLTNVSDYGTALGAAGRLDDAEAVLRRGLRGRLDFYGREHPGYAFGLEPLVTVLLQKGLVGEALDAQEEVIGNFAASGHPRFLQALVILAAARVAGGAAEPPLAGFTANTPAAARVAVQEMAEGAIDWLETYPVAVQRVVLWEVAALAAENLGEAHPARLQLLVKMVNNEGDAAEPDHALRIACVKELFRAHESKRDYKAAGEALLGLAMVQGDAGDIADASASYDRARIAAQYLGDWVQASSAERNHALMLSAIDRESADASRTR